MKVIRIADVPSKSVSMEGAAGVRIQVLLAEVDGAPSFTMRRFQVEPGGQTPRHAHSHEHEVIVDIGSGTLWTADGTHRLEAGMVVLVGPDEEHQFRAGPEGLSFFCIVPHAGHGG
jgi:quercetin dioxygenase-like cupin family protein